MLKHYQAGIVMVAAKHIARLPRPRFRSLIVQLLIGIIVGIIATLRLWKARLVLGIKRETEDEVDGDDVEELDLS